MDLENRLTLGKQAYSKITLLGITSPGIEQVLLSDGSIIRRSDLSRRVLLALFELDLGQQEHLTILFQKGEVANCSIVKLISEWQRVLKDNTRSIRL